MGCNDLRTVAFVSLAWKNLGEPGRLETSIVLGRTRRDCVPEFISVRVFGTVLAELKGLVGPT